MSIRALITGITGQDGSYLAELLLEKGYEVFGIVRRASVISTGRINHLLFPEEKINLVYGDLGGDIESIIHDIKPELIFNLASMSHVRVSFDVPIYTMDINAIGPTRILEAVRHSGLKNTTRFYQASCYDKKTRIATPQGIKTYNEIKVGDLVYSVNVETNELELKRVKKVIVHEHDGVMNWFMSRRLDICVTPNHNMLLDHTDNGLFYCSADAVEQYLPYTGASPLYMPCPHWVGKEQDTVDFANYINTEERHYTCTRNLIKSMNTKDFMYLLGLYIGDGYTSPKKKEFRTMRAIDFINRKKDKKGRFVKLSVAEKENKQEVIRQSNLIYFAIPKKDPARKRLLRVLDKYDIDYFEDALTIHFSSYTLARMFKLSGDNVYEKHIPPMFLQLAKKYLVYLAKGIIDSDGHWRKTKTGKRAQLSTVSSALKDSFVELVIKLGYVPKVIRVKASKPFYIREQRYFATKPSYQIYIAQKKRIKLYKSNNYQVLYKGAVWCLEVEDNHNFLVERNGFYAFSGNSSEIFGTSPPPQSETTSFCPCSPYGIAKLAGFWMTKTYRDGYGIFASNGILFNHESIRRGETFVTKKIVRGAVRIKLDKQEDLVLGNLAAKRDWGHSQDYMHAIIAIMEHATPDDFVVATGQYLSIMEFVNKVFSKLDLDWKRYVKYDERYTRPKEVPELCGNPAKIKNTLRWEPRISIDQLVDEMVAGVLEEERNARN